MVRPVFCNLSTHDAACILISSAIHASSVIVTERKALWSVKWLHCLENDRWPTVIFSSAMSITWNCIPTTLVVHRAICHMFYTTNHCGYWGDSHWQAVTAPLCGTFCLLLGYRNYYAIHGSPYTSAHGLIENTLVQHKMAQNSGMALCCKNGVSKGTNQRYGLHNRASISVHSTSVTELGLLKKNYYKTVF